MSYVADAGGAETPDPDAPVDHKNTLDWSAIATDKLTATGQYDLNAVDGTPLETPIAKFDGAALTTEVFAGTSNSFLSVVGGKYPIEMVKNFGIQTRIKLPLTQAVLR